MYRLRFLGHRIEPYAGLGWRLKLGLTEHVGQLIRDVRSASLSVVCVPELQHGVP